MVVARGLSLLALLNWGPPRENGDCTIRLARRDDLLRIASLINGAFAIPRERNGLERSLNTARLALDVERRLTPWNWNRHQQLVAESSGGDILGFVELWAEDSASVDKLDAQTPQPCLFNLCVAEGARRSGVARQLLRSCEDECERNGQRTLYLKVDPANTAALALYRRVSPAHFPHMSQPILPIYRRHDDHTTCIVLQARGLRNTRL